VICQLFIGLLIIGLWRLIDKGHVYPNTRVPFW
jgi:hypothetical protein